MKKILPLILVSSLIFVNGTYAVVSDNSDKNNYGDLEVNDNLDNDKRPIKASLYETRTMLNNKKAEKTKEFQEELKKMKEENIRKIKENRDNMLKNRQEYRAENKEQLKEAFSGIDQEKKDELKSLSEENRSEIEALKEEYKGELIDETTREEYKQKLKELTDKHFEEIKTMIGDEENIDLIMQERKQVFDENQKLRQENMNARIEYRGERAGMIEKYKENFIKRLEAAIPKIKIEKLSTVADKIETMIGNIENNNRLSDDKKDSLVSQLVALKEIVEEEIENRGMMEDLIDIDAILAD